MEWGEFVKPIIEGLLFLAGEDGVSFEQIKSVVELKDEELANLLKEMVTDYEKTDRGIRMEILGKKFKLVTKKEHKDYYKKFFCSSESGFLSQSALETLAIIAYNQPITRVRVDEIRGVSSSHIMRKLLSLELIYEVGRSDLPGRPILYSVTDRFLDHFGLSSIDDLPVLEVVSEEKEDTDLFQSKYHEEDSNVTNS